MMITIIYRGYYRPSNRIKKELEKQAFIDTFKKPNKPSYSFNSFKPMEVLLNGKKISNELAKNLFKSFKFEAQEWSVDKEWNVSVKYTAENNLVLTAFFNKKEILDHIVL